jgi:acyl-CoA dehydrogenase
MACSDPEEPKHSRHTMFVMDADTPGIEILRPMQVFGHDDAPHGHMHLRFSNVRLPASAVVLGEGRGFEVAQGRLGPGRIHHCMRAIGQAEKALEMMCKRGLAREAFGKQIIELGANYDIIANARMEIEMARLLCLKAAYMMDTAGVRAARRCNFTVPRGFHRIRTWPICGPTFVPCVSPMAPTPSTAAKSRGQS